MEFTIEGICKELRKRGPNTKKKVIEALTNANTSELYSLQRSISTTIGKLSIRNSKCKTKLELVMFEKHIKARQLSKACGISESAVSRYINGSRKPRIDIAIKIGQYLEMGLEEVYGGNYGFISK